MSLRLFLRKHLKNLFIFVASNLLKLYTFAHKKQLNSKELKVIAIPFLPVLGIGDLMMHSPMIVKIATHFNNSSVYVITKIPVLQKFPSNVNFISPNQKIPTIDLLISITPHLGHAKYIFGSKFWIGYFFESVGATNIKGKKKFDYPNTQVHHLEKSNILLQHLFENKNSDWNQFYQSETLTYPSILLEKIEIEKSPYVTVGLFSKYDHGLWSLDKAAYVIDHLYEFNKDLSFVILGDRSARNKNLAAELIQKLNIPARNIINFVGKTSLKQAAYTAKHSEFYFGLDTGISHIAYFTAPISFVVFIIAKPEYRLPKNLTIQKNIHTFDPYAAEEMQLYDDRNPVELAKSKAIGNRIDEREMTLKIINILSTKHT